MFKTIWKFKVKPDKRATFEDFYGPKGQWAQLFSKAKGYIGTELLKCTEEGFYITIDMWASQKDFENFKAQWIKEYETLDKQCEQLTESETHVGAFTVNKSD